MNFFSERSKRRREKKKKIIMSSVPPTAVRDPSRRAYRRLKDEKPEETEMKEKRRLIMRLDSDIIAWHTIAAFVQLVSSVLLLAFYLSNAWDIRDNSVKGQLSNDKVFAHEAKDVQTYDLFPILIAIPAIAFASHVIQILLIWFGGDDSWFRKDYLKGSNQIRWLEYAISATLQTWIIAQLAGSVNIWINISVAILGNIALQLTGYLHERANRDKFTILREYHKVAGIRYWLWFILGSVIFLAQWGWLMASFIIAVDKADEAVPAFVTVVFFVTFGLFALFAVVMLMRMLGVSWFYAVDTYEIWYIILSILAKLAIDWIIFFGVAAAF